MDSFYGTIEEVRREGGFRFFLVLRVRDTGERVGISITDIHSFVPWDNGHMIIVSSGNIRVSDVNEIIDRAVWIKMRIQTDKVTEIPSGLVDCQVHVRPMHN